MKNKSVLLYYKHIEKPVPAQFYAVFGQFRAQYVARFGLTPSGRQKDKREI
jgi:hypothetical protein